MRTFGINTQNPAWTFRNESKFTYVPEVSFSFSLTTTKRVHKRRQPFLLRFVTSFSHHPGVWEVNLTHTHKKKKKKKPNGGKFSVIIVDLQENLQCSCTETQSRSWGALLFHLMLLTSCDTARVISKMTRKKMENNFYCIWFRTLRSRWVSVSHPSQRER